MRLRPHAPVHCIFGTCNQAATHRISRGNAHLPLCPDHRRMLEADGIITEPIPGADEAAHTQEPPALRQSA